MTKSEAAQALGVSEKTITRYTTSGKLPFQYIRGKTGQQVDITLEAVEALRRELETPVIPGTEAEPGQDGQGETTQARQSKTLATLPSSGSVPAWAIELTRAAYEAGTTQAGTGKSSQDSPSELAAKLTLTLDEAATLSGISRHALRAAIGEGALPARQIGRGWKLRPVDLKTWTDGLFTNGAGQGRATQDKPSRAKGSRVKS